MNISIFGYDLTINYFPGSPGDELTGPTEPDFEIVEAYSQEDGHKLTPDEEDEYLDGKVNEIWDAINKIIENVEGE